MKSWKLSGSGLLAVIGLLSCAAGTLLYWRYGFNPHLWIAWAGGCTALAVAGAHLSPKYGPAGNLPEKPGGHERPANRTNRYGVFRRLKKGDWLAAGAILLVFAPLYLINVHNFPRQMNTDEVAIMNAERLLSANPSTDIYGPSFYSDLPALIFWIFGKIGMAIGGVTLGHMRLLHAVSGLLIIVLCFILARLLALPRPAALAAASVVALNHSFYIFARFAMRDNTSALFELLALVCLYTGWQKRHYGWTILGGFFGGLTFYTYYPSRMTMVVWLAFVFMAVVLKRQHWWTATKLAAVALLGTLIILSPLLIGDSRHVPTDPYPTHQFLWQQAAREQERAYRGTATIRQALEINATHGLLVFNKPYADQGLLYINPGYGFVDTLTGILLWAGVVAVIAVSVWRRRLSNGDLFGLTGFLVIWLSLALLITRAPDYTRLFIVLPFVGYFIGRFVQVCGEVLRKVWLRRGSWLLPWAVATAAIVAVACMNFLPVRAYYRAGARDGDGVGDTIRFEELHNTENAAWLFAPGTSTQYFFWGIPQYWEGWIAFDKGEGQPLQMATVDDILTNNVNPLPLGAHGYFLTTSDTWDSVKQTFESHWHVSAVRYLDPAHNRVVITYTAR